MGEDAVYFKDLALGGIPLCRCELALDYEGGYRLYVNRRDSGFDAMAVEFVSCFDKDTWSCDMLMVSQLFLATAYYDGVRHLEFNREVGATAGYIYYPDTKGLIELFSKVRGLEVEQCTHLPTEV